MKTECKTGGVFAVEIARAQAPHGIVAFQDDGIAHGVVDAKGVHAALEARVVEKVLWHFGHCVVAIKSKEQVALILLARSEKGHDVVTGFGVKCIRGTGDGRSQDVEVVG